jgi:hypothetical protein
MQQGGIDTPNAQPHMALRAETVAHQNQHPPAHRCFIMVAVPTSRARLLESSMNSCICGLDLHAAVVGLQPGSTTDCDGVMVSLTVA